MEGWKIKKLRKELKLTQVKLADKLGVHFCTVNRWENGKEKPSNLAMTRLRMIAIENGWNLDDYKKIKHGKKVLRGKRRSIIR